MKDTSPIYVTRTWEVALYGSYGEGPSASVLLARRTVTLSGGRDAKGQPLPILAEVDGQPTTEREAVRLLNRAKRDGRVTLLNEERTVPTIGKARAHELHRLLGSMGVPSREHYGFAVYSLAELTEVEADAVRGFLMATHGEVAA